MHFKYCTEAEFSDVHVIVSLDALWAFLGVIHRILSENLF
jgi:hypothetical protein